MNKLGIIQNQIFPFLYLFSPELICEKMFQRRNFFLLNDSKCQSQIQNLYKIIPL